ncbi:uracil-xanthine permease family protein [Paeniglutamicibacter gangotriensis]|uniref:NCS2 family nucleobase:cation symporter-2 n=1 Tax=Paeniglutamicibacter gangotriensis Lz1y TaxID=1276920 RepID=M7MUB6_9MICC|nr:solute carrier family 23 protein [Paeniglutamicibacter gangotriensis]EMR00033.1 NCS2 family nucleobase:cation symporter-2 [Paeniglutamicibacter gangotriensis Lz1y]
MSNRFGIGWRLHGDGKSITPGTVVAPDERLAWPQTIGVGVQHVMAMFGATVLVPTLTGFPVTTTLLFTGIGTLLFLIITAGRVPSYLGSSFAFIAPVTGAMATHGMGGALGGIVMAGAALFIVGLIVQKAGTGWIHALMPPVVMGTIVALIGLNLATSTTDKITEVPLTTFATVLAIIITTVLFKGMLGRLSILLGIIVGYLVAWAQGQVDFSAITDAPWIGLPDFAAPAFHLDTLTLFLPVVFVLIAENVGHVKTVALMTGKELDDVNGRALMADGAATMIAGAGGGSGTTTYAENIGVMASSRVYSTAAYWVAGAVAITVAFLPKFGVLINTIPPGVAGGAGIVLYGMIAIVGARLWVQHKVDFSNPINLMTAGTGLIIAIALYGDNVLSVGNMSFGGIALGTAATLLVFHLMSSIAKVRGTEPVAPAESGSASPSNLG